jgi:hypothetical protein
LVKEEHIVQVLTRADGTHKFIEDLMWKVQIEERQKGVADGITSAQLHIIKEALEKMKVDYLQLFMDRDLALKFVEDKEREIEELCYQLSMAHSSSLTTTETPPYLAMVTHEGMSGTHDMREEPLVMIPHEEHSELQVFEESFDTKGFDHASIFHCREHEPFLWAQGLATKIVVEKIPCGPANKDVYAPVDWGTKYRVVVDTSLWDPGSVDISRVIDSEAHMGYMMVHDDTVVCSGIQQYTTVYNGVQWDFGTFPLGRPPDRDFRHITEFGPPRIDEWMDEPHGEVYPSEIDLRLGCHQSRDKESRIPAGFLSDATLSSWSYHWG